MPKAQRKRDAGATRAALIAAGEKVFAAHGFEGATLDRLAEASGANKAMVSYYFGSKAGLHEAVVEVIVGEVVSAVNIADRGEKDPAAAFAGYIRALALALAARPTFAQILMREYVGGEIERAAPFRQVLHLYRMTEARYLAGRSAGAFRAIDPHMLHLTIVGALVHFILSAGFRRSALPEIADDIEDPSIEAFASHLSRVLLDSLRRPA